MAKGGFTVKIQSVTAYRLHSWWGDPTPIPADTLCTGCYIKCKDTPTLWNRLGGLPNAECDVIPTVEIIDLDDVSTW